MRASSTILTWYERALLLRPRTVLANLERVRAAGGLDVEPTPWQLSLAVLRMWHRTLLRPETVGTSAGPVRSTWRARALRHKALRLPALLVEGAVVPFDFTGLGSAPATLIRHLLGAHHDRHQSVFDLEILAAHGELPTLRRAVAELVAADTPRARWLRDLTVYEGYHEALLTLVEAACAGRFELTAAEAVDPDVSFRACMRWCAQQPATPAATLAAWRAGAFRIDGGLAEGGA
jgi:hypothetical protein